MAASLRLKLLLDGSVCTPLSPRKCWFFVNLNGCNTVADLEHLVRQRFELDRAVKLDLYLDDFLLPSIERIHVVRDNDTLRVKLSEVGDVDGERLKNVKSPSPKINSPCPEEHGEKSAKSRKKISHRLHHKTSSKGKEGEDSESPAEKPEKTGNGTSESTHDLFKERRQSRKRKHAHKETVRPSKTPETTSRRSSSESNGSNGRPADLKRQTPSGAEEHRIRSKMQAKSESTSKCKEEKKMEKKKKKKKKKEEKKEKRASVRYLGLSEVCGTSSAGKTQRKEKESLAFSPAQLKSRPGSGYDPDGGLKELGEVSASTLPRPTAGEATPPSVDHTYSQASAISRTGTGPAGPVEGSRRQKKLASTVVSAGHIRFDSGSESEASSTEGAGGAGGAGDGAHAQQADGAQTAAEQAQPETCPGPEPSAASAAGDRLPEPRPPVPTIPGDHMNSSPAAQPASDTGGGQEVAGDRLDGHANVRAEERQDCRQNPIQVADEAVPKDYGSFPSLVGPPRQGDVIAYKILELSETYCPQLSDYKEAKVLTVDLAAGQIGVELSSVSMVTLPSKMGKFELSWEDPETEDADEAPQVASPEDLLISLQLQDIVEARLVPSCSA